MKRITCKVWNNPTDQVITHVGVEGEGTRSMVGVWDRIKAEESFYVLANGQRVAVLAKARGGKKYLTTNRDGFVPNNLDALPSCIV